MLDKLRLITEKMRSDVFVKEAKRIAKHYNIEILFNGAGFPSEVVQIPSDVSTFISSPARGEEGIRAIKTEAEVRDLATTYGFNEEICQNVVRDQAGSVIGNYQAFVFRR